MATVTVHQPETETTNMEVAVTEVQVTDHQTEAATGTAAHVTVVTTKETILHVAAKEITKNNQQVI